MLIPIYDREVVKYLENCKDKKYIKKVLDLIYDACKHPYEGLGKPEQLKGALKGKWSRRIDKKNRLIYSVVKPNLLVISIVGHYE